MKAEVEIISPAQAKEFLERNPHNRPLSEFTVRRYADDMQNDRWNSSNGETIKVSLNGDLVDGQHRMAALIRANRPVAMLVVRGIDPIAFKTIDAGKTRNLKDTLSLEGYKKVDILASAGRMSYNYIAGVTYNYSPTPSTTEEFIRAYPYLGELAKKLGNHSHNRFPKSALTAVLFLANDNRQLDSELKTFIEGLMYGQGLWKGDARLTLREWMNNQQITKTGRRVGVRTNLVFSAIARAWNAFASGKELSMIKMIDFQTRATLPIFGFTPELYPDVPDLKVNIVEVARSNLAEARKHIKRKVTVLETPSTF